MNADKVVIGLAGMPGSGKSLIVEAARELGYTIVVMGDVIREETLKSGLDLNPENVGKVMLGLREKGGNAIIAQKSIPKIEEQACSKVLVDGLRSLFEVDAFKAHFPRFITIAVHASQKTRFSRLKIRSRSDDTNTWEVFHERDMRELGVGLGNVIAMAEYIIMNDNSPKQCKIEAVDLLRGIEEKWMM